MPALKLSPKWINSTNKPEIYLEKIKQEGEKYLIESGYPNPKSEPWRLTNIKLLERFINLPNPLRKDCNYKDKYPLFDSKSDGVFQIIIDDLDDPISAKSLPSGIRILSDSEIKKYLGETIGKCNAKELWSTKINESSVNKVIGLGIQGQDLPNLELLIPGSNDAFNSTRILIKIEANTSIKLNQIIIGCKNSAQSNLLEMIIGENSDVEHGLISIGGGDASLITNFAVQQDIKSNYSLISLHEGWIFSRFEPHIIQVQGQAITQLKGLQVATNNEQLSTHSQVRFEGPEGKLDQINKTCADKNSHSLFNGAIQVPRIAQKTEASQLSRNLILSKRAKVDTKPELEIVADDVRCTHGATISQLQEEELFYLRSRGIESSEANSLLLEGYYQEIVSSLPLYSERFSFLKNILLKLI